MWWELKYWYDVEGIESNWKKKKKSELFPLKSSDPKQDILLPTDFSPFSSLMCKLPATTTFRREQELSILDYYTHPWVSRGSVPGPSQIPKVKEAQVFI